MHGGWNGGLRFRSLKCCKLLEARVAREKRSGWIWRQLSSKFSDLDIKWMYTIYDELVFYQRWINLWQSVDVLCVHVVLNANTLWMNLVMIELMSCLVWCMLFNEIQLYDWVNIIMMHNGMIGDYMSHDRHYMLVECLYMYEWYVCGFEEVKWSYTGLHMHYIYVTLREVRLDWAKKGEWCTLVFESPLCGTYECS